MYLGIDLGTSGCRVCAIDGDGRERASLAHPLPAPQRDGARIEQDPTLWWQAVQALLDSFSARIPAAEVRSLAVDGTSASLLLADGQGQALGPALMYNDSRARTEAERITALAPARSGAHGPSSSLAKLLYLLGQEPAGQPRHALHQADWISGCLGGRWGVSDENNALKLGYDVEQRRWPDWLDALDLPPGLLPEVVPPGTSIGTLRADLAHRWGFPEDTRIVAGTTDSTAGFLATGAHAPGTAVTSLGSTLVLKVLSPRPVFAPEYGVYSHRLGDLWLAGGASNSGGAVLLQYFSRAQLVELTPRLRPEVPTGLDYYPLCAPGERFPIQDPRLAARIEPVPEDPVQLLQGLLEGMAGIEAQGYRLLAELGAPYPTEVRSVGGGAMNAAWTCIRADRLGVPVVRAEHQEAAYGAALLARGM
ncbi:MAG: FGGY-family carbohydrate kinase [Xanthomonadaceae bacterium]|nr:FGGY-family carbohydrate kinase [Xanthomonadaceae bacterium]